jgi:hypothetical protein
VRVEAQRQRLREALVPGSGQLMESMAGLARGAQLRDQKAVGLALARSANPLGGVDRNVGRRERGGFQYILRVNRASVRGIGDSRPYHSYCIEEAAAHVARNFPDNVVVCLMVLERCNLPVEPSCLRLLFGIRAQIVYSAGMS